MKAVRIHEYGGANVLQVEETNKPQPGRDEVLVRVHASAINPVDIHIREGKAKEMFPTDLPLTLGWDLSGVVESFGIDVNGFNIGDEIYGRPDLTHNGAYAEYITVKASQLSKKPTNLGFNESASVPLAGLTAWQALFDHGQLQPGEKVLIHGASGGVGSFAVQFARWKGAYVIGTASQENADFVRKLGADEVIDYKTGSFETKLKDIDLVLDTQGGETQKKSFQVLKEGGRLVTTLKPEPDEASEAKKIQVIGFMAQSYPEELKSIAELIEQGKVKPVVSRVFTLDQAAEAQDFIENGHVRGKIVLQVMEESEQNN